MIRQDLRRHQAVDIPDFVPLDRWLKARLYRVKLHRRRGATCSGDWNLVWYQNVAICSPKLGVSLDALIWTVYGKANLWKVIMTQTTKMSWDDTVLPFQLDASDIRGRVARLDGVLDQVLAQHDYPSVVEALVAEMALLTALIGETMKLRWKLSLQVRGSGAVRLIATDDYGPTEDGAPARIRAYASYDAETLNTEALGFDQIGNGYFAILIDQGQAMQPYQGITPIAGASLSACAEAYFAQSEQIPTRFSLAFGYSQEADGTDGWRAGGVMLQHIPAAGSHVTSEEPLGEDGLLSAADLLDPDGNENWNRVNILLDTVDQLELVGPSIEPTQLLLRLFHEEQPRVYDTQPVTFGCTCSSDRVRQSLSIYSSKDIAHMTTDDNEVTADCQFCGAHYSFDPDTLGFEAKTPVENDFATS